MQPSPCDRCIHKAQVQQVIGSQLDNLIYYKTQMAWKKNKEKEDKAIPDERGGSNLYRRCCSE